MPANLTPDYLAAEQRFREARTPKEKLEALEEMLRTIPKHKGTDHMQADIKRRMAQVKKESQKKSVTAVHAYYVKPEGLAQIFLVGPPNSGKSALLAALTNAKPEVAPYPFTTSIYLPGMMRFEDVWIQLVDMPPVSGQAMMPWIPSVVRYGNGALLVLSLASDDLLTEAEEVLSILARAKVVLARREEETGMFETGIAALRTLVVCTHCQDPHAADRLELLNELLRDQYDMAFVETQADPATVEPLRGRIFGMLGKLRVYTKQPGKPPDMKDPFVLKIGTTVEELAGRIHKDVQARLQYARVWSRDDRTFEGQRVARNYLLQEGDVIEIHV
jgi:ribosome-interacting GTPase 1